MRIPGGPRNLALALALLGALVCAAALRLPDLAARPMHFDEANQAYRAGILLDTGVYRYDPLEHHGPVLYYAGVLSAWLHGQHRFIDTDEATYRLVPVAAGLLVVVTAPLFVEVLGATGVVTAAAFIATSPAMVYYSRYYIQETLLVLFTALFLGALFRYALTRQMRWALLAGLSAGLMYATKETCVLAFASMAAAAMGTFLLARARRIPISIHLRMRDLVLALAATGVVALVFYSAFFTDPQGPANSVRAFFHFAERSSGPSLHDKPWYYYLGLLAWHQDSRERPVWTEAAVLALAAVGCIHAMRSREHGPAAEFRRFLALYAIVLLTAYSVIAYKTPWCVMSPLHALQLLAGLGLMALWRRWPSRGARALIAAMLVLALSQLAAQSTRATGTYAARPENPYVYAHTSQTYRHLVERVKDIAGIAPAGREITIAVVCPGKDYWPLPWDLRRYKRVGFWEEPPSDIDADIVIASPAVQSELESRLAGAWHSEYFGFRPGVLRLVYVRQALWEAFIQTRSAAE